MVYVFSFFSLFFRINEFLFLFKFFITAPFSLLTFSSTSFPPTYFTTSFSLTYFTTYTTSSTFGFLGSGGLLYILLSSVSFLLEVSSYSPKSNLLMSVASGDFRKRLFLSLSRDLDLEVFCWRSSSIY